MSRQTNNEAELIIESPDEGGIIFLNESQPLVVKMPIDSTDDRWHCEIESHFLALKYSSIITKESAITHAFLIGHIFDLSSWHKATTLYLGQIKWTKANKDSVSVHLFSSSRKTKFPLITTVVNPPSRAVVPMVVGEILELVFLDTGIITCATPDGVSELERINSTHFLDLDCNIELLNGPLIDRRLNALTMNKDGVPTKRPTPGLPHPNMLLTVSHHFFEIQCSKGDDEVDVNCYRSRIPHGVENLLSIVTVNVEHSDIRNATQKHTIDSINIAIDNLKNSLKDEKLRRQVPPTVARPTTSLRTINPIDEDVDVPIDQDSSIRIQLSREKWMEADGVTTENRWWASVIKATFLLHRNPYLVTCSHVSFDKTDNVDVFEVSIKHSGMANKTHEHYIATVMFNGCNGAVRRVHIWAKGVASANSESNSWQKKDTYLLPEVTIQEVLPHHINTEYVVLGEVVVGKRRNRHKTQV